jgi:hypothetical protein
MRSIQLLSLALSGAALVAAIPRPQAAETTSESSDDLPTSAAADPVVALDQLEQLADFATLATNELLGNGTTAKRAPCTLANLRVRRNW